MNYYSKDLYHFRQGVIDMNLDIILPAIYAVDERCNKNIIQQLIIPSQRLEVTVKTYNENRVKGYLLISTNDSSEQILAIYNTAKPPMEFNRVLRLKPDDLPEKSHESVDLSHRKWDKHPKLSKIKPERINYTKRLRNVLNSWNKSFSYKIEDRDNNIPGLRPPQIGSVHATHAHWSVSNEAATIVMPTGTGKTETMLSILISKQCQKLLVVVPTDVLRTQIAEKFLTLGILKDNNIVSSKGLYPIVGILKQRPKTCDDLDLFFSKCNVIVTTMNIAGLSDSDIQERMAYHCPYLFIDEAHHSPAKTWTRLKEKFYEKRILQFTATPFRNDGKYIDGKTIYNYPLRIAQKEKYFTTINFDPIIELDPLKADYVIADKAVNQLINDLKKYDHILMARAATISKAEKLFTIYQKYTDFNPVLIHSRLDKMEKTHIWNEINLKHSRIVICVDMFGEGFDFPEMKIAAFHDIRKSLAVTIQLAGRFTRLRDDLGDATIITNIADVTVEDKLKKLYYQDSDWNYLLQEVSEESMQEKVELEELLAGFDIKINDITLKNLRPAMSTVVYKTKCDNWNPDNYKKGIHASESLDRLEHTINREKHTLVIVTAKKIPVDWAQSTTIFNWNWDLYIIFWDKIQNLLFIHSSNKDSQYEKLAEVVAGEVDIIQGGEVFRCLSGINHLQLQNVGLIEHVGRLIRYTMRTGPDIEPALTEAQRQKASKSNIYGTGYEDGVRTTIGCSYKGRIWARRKTDLDTLRKWCSTIGEKVLDSSIDPEKVLQGTLIPKTISTRPIKMPISIDWPIIFYKDTQKTIYFEFGTEQIPIYLTEINLINPANNGELDFEITSDGNTEKIKLNLNNNKYSFTTAKEKKTVIHWGKNSAPLTKFFYENPPIIRFVDGSTLEGNTYTELKIDSDPYPRNKIKTMDWNKIDIKKESQGLTKNSDTIQFRVIDELKKKKDYNVIFDDDGPGEVADIVCINIHGNAIMVEFYHCKYSKGTTPGSRINDLYEVCGQAQKSINWMENSTRIFENMLRREGKRLTNENVSRFEKGTSEELLNIKEMSRNMVVHLTEYIVQPGLSKSKASREQLELLSVTQNYLMETRKVPLVVIASD